MKSMNIRDLENETFHRICVVGGGITGAIMVLLLKKSNMFKLSEICWIKPHSKSIDDLRTTFYNKTSIELLKDLAVLKKIKKNDLTNIKKIKVFGVNNASPIEWNYEDSNTKLGAVIKNNIVLSALEKQLEDLLDELNSTLRPRIERPIRKRPLLAMGIAAGIGVLFGILLGGGRRN